MNPSIEITICAVIGALLPAGILLLNERRLRRIAEARLMLAKAATGADQLMLAGEIRLGDVCHDYVCKMIFATQGVKSFNVQWNPFTRLTEEQVKFQKLLEKELVSNHGMCETMNLYVRGFAKAFRNSHPI